MAAKKKTKAIKPAVSEGVKDSTLEKLTTMRELAERLVAELRNGESVETEADAQASLNEAEGYLGLIQNELDLVEEE